MNGGVLVSAPVELTLGKVKDVEKVFDKDSGIQIKSEPEILMQLEEIESAQTVPSGNPSTFSSLGSIGIKQKPSSAKKSKNPSRSTEDGTPPLKKKRASVGKEERKIKKEPSTSVDGATSQRKSKQKDKSNEQQVVVKEEPGLQDRSSPSLADKCKLCDQADNFMIECSECGAWFHGGCVGISERMAERYDKYHCRVCARVKGPSILYERRNDHRQNSLEEGAENKKTENGSPRFMRELLKRKFKDVKEFLLDMKGRDLDVEFLREKGFTHPIIVRDRAGLDLVVPSDEFDYERIVSRLGASRKVVAIDVPSQEDGVEILLSEYLEYMRSPKPRETILNIISLEFTNTRLAEIVEPPLVVRELSWADNLFKDGQAELAESGYTKPEVQKYCLMSAEGSYTDFHIDFGGTSVWYHIFRGSKVFYLIQPTDENLALYESWMKSDNQSERFLGDETGCYKLELKEGETILLPSGWIHAVYTPVDSLVFGGNFLHHLSAHMQIEVNKMELRMGTGERYRYPHFHTTLWLALHDVFELIVEKEKDKKKPVPHWAITACIAVYTELKEWMVRPGVSHAEAMHLIPSTVDVPRLMKDVKTFLKKKGLHPDPWFPVHPSGRF